MRRLDAWEMACLAVILAGAALRLEFLGGRAIDADAAEYASMGRMLLEYGEFVIPWASGLEYTHHFPPLFPAVLALAFAVFGPSFFAIKFASAFIGILFVGVVFAFTRDLYGRRVAFAVTAIAATLPTLLRYDHLAMSETFVAMLFAVTIWAILRSLDDPRFIVVAGVFAGLSFLAKASMGPFFLLAGAAGLAWRFAYVRWAVFKDRWYLLAVTLFAALVVPWSARNLLRHGWPNWQTQLSAQEALDGLLANPTWPWLVVQALVWITLLVLLQCLPLLPGLKDVRGKFREERTSGLLLATFTPLLVACFFVAAFSLKEGWRLTEGLSPLRYAITPIVPLLWLAMRGLDLGRRLPDATAPTARVRIEIGLQTTGALLLAVALALRYPWRHEPAASRWSLILLILAGLTLIGLARLFAWRTEEVKRKSTTERRVLPERISLLPLAAVIPLGVFSLVFPEDLVASGIAAAAAWLARGWRSRVLIAAIVLLGWSAGGYVWTINTWDIQDHLEANAVEGDTLAAPPSQERWFYAMLPDKVSMVPWHENATWRVQGSPAPAPPGYVEVLEGKTTHDLPPGGALRVFYEESHGNRPEFQSAYKLYRRADV